MDFFHLSPVWARRAVAAVLVAAALAAAFVGCSGSSGELRTPAQETGFVAEVASGEPYDDWKLTGDASRQAVQAWAARTTISDLGRKLRDAAILPPSAKATWTCEMARNLVSLGAVGTVTSFNSHDVEIVTGDARQLSVKPDQISAMIHDASTVPFLDLAIATAVACGPKVF